MIVRFVEQTIIYHPNSLNTRKTATSPKRTVIYHPNRTPSTQERPRHLQNKQSSIILTELHEHKNDHDIYKTNNYIDDCSFCRCRVLSCDQGVLLG
jgi:hypothetical protein